MKRILERIKQSWALYWEDDECDMTRHHLSQHDKRYLLLGGCSIGMGVLFLTTVTAGISNHRAAKDMETAMDMISTYMATATEDEYEEIAETIRRDLVYSDYGKDIEYLIRCIPNTAESCCLEQEGHPARANLVFPNTGTLYGLDIYEEGETPEPEHFETRLTFGYDEVSEASLLIMKTPNDGSGTASFRRERRIVSAQKMKGRFCDDCIRKILNATMESQVQEACIYDAVEMAFYPIEEGELQIGDYHLLVEYDMGNYEIEIAYTGE